MYSYPNLLFGNLFENLCRDNMTTPTSPACRRTSARIRAYAAIRLSVRVGNVLRARVGPEGDAGQLNVTHVRELFVADNERDEALRLIELAKRWLRSGSNNQ